VAPRVAREAVEKRIAPPGDIVVVPSAVDLDDIPVAADPGVRTELGVPQDAPLVGTVGRIVAQKCPLDFVRMAALIHAERPDVRFVMVGDATLESADLEAETRREAERLGVPVIFTGFRADAPRVAAAFDVYVVPSLYEGLGRAVTEAMASARPVVATAVNGVPDLVAPGVTGLLAAPRDPAGLASAVLWMLDHSRDAARMGLQGRELVRAHFARKIMCDALDELYSELLGLPVHATSGQVGVDVLPEQVRRTAATTRCGSPSPRRTASTPIGGRIGPTANLACCEVADDDTRGPSAARECAERRCRECRRSSDPAEDPARHPAGRPDEQPVERALPAGRGRA
jgi:hypothetical protein